MIVSTCIIRCVGLGLTRHNIQPRMLRFAAPELARVFWREHWVGLECDDLLRELWREACDVAGEFIGGAFAGVSPSFFYEKSNDN